MKKNLNNNPVNGVSSNDDQQQQQQLASPKKMKMTSIDSARALQMENVRKLLVESHFMSEDLINSEITWFFTSLGLDESYFSATSDANITNHILSIFGAKTVAYSSGDAFSLRTTNEYEDRALYVVSSDFTKSTPPSLQVEYRIEQNYLGEGSKLDLINSDKSAQTVTGTTTSIPQPQNTSIAATTNNNNNNNNNNNAASATTSSATTTTTTKTVTPYRVQVYRSMQPVVQGTPDAPFLRIYMVQQSVFPNAPKENPQDCSSIELTGTPEFLQKASANTISIFQAAMNESMGQLHPVIKSYILGEEVRIVICFQSGSTHNFFSGINSLYRYCGLYSSRKYIEPFANGKLIYSIYLRQMTNTRSCVPPEILQKSFKERIDLFLQDLTLTYILPRTSLTPMVLERKLSPSEVIYAYCAWKFVYHFLNAFECETNAMANLGLEKNAFMRLQGTLRLDAFTEGRVMEAIQRNPDIVKSLYQDFSSYHNPYHSNRNFTYDVNHNVELFASIKKNVNDEVDARVLAAMLYFNRHVLKTNFFLPQKVALSFRLDPVFLSKMQYARTPFALFFVIGAEFRGFHIRFDQIARGGIRIITSPRYQTYAANLSTMFGENYGLAHTQHQKNKDIPEGGSKGTILLSLDYQQPQHQIAAFKKYVDSILDILLVNDPNVIVDFRDNTCKNEILFFGPDEGTADLMDFASQHAKKRGATFWKAFTTGKSVCYGGIPHDMFGMTTTSIRQYVEGIYRKLNLDSKKMLKFQTGGPDGDLGSNEIKMSDEKLIGIVDGSGVLYDPEGLDHTELLRLANSHPHRLPSSYFDKSKLSKMGFFVDVNSKSNITLPDGTVVEQGMYFRNSFHTNPLALKAEVFVPCGGRPESIDIRNVNLFYNNETKTPYFKYIVEGANLFISQQAREKLESFGVILFKDASANKGGVTSSSLEVLSALAMSDAAFEKYMCVKDLNNPPAFYTDYVNEIKQIISDNAKLEFELLWREHAATGEKFCILTDLVSAKINSLNEAITAPIDGDCLYDDVAIRTTVLGHAIPKTLQKLCPLADIVSRVPQSYLRAIFGAWIASRYVYTVGLNANEFQFFAFMRKLLKNQ